MLHRAFMLGCVIGAVSLMVSAAPGAASSFRNDVVAVLSKAGCNTGPCHGNANGKGGFKLSLRGEDAERDYLALTRDLYGRRLDLAHPEESLLLLKPTTGIAHEGGLRFSRDSIQYAILRDWIAAGANDDFQSAPKLTGLTVIPDEVLLVEPTNEVRVTALASFSEGRQRDVTALAVYEPADVSTKVDPTGLVRMTRPGETTVTVRYLDRQVPVRVFLIPNRTVSAVKPAPRRNYIDDHVFAKLERLRIEPADLCTDSEYLRRAYLDLLGALPTSDEARSFVADRDPDKRDRLVARLLDRPEFADFWALKWADLLRNEEKVLDRKGVQAFHRWIRESIATNQPLDRFVAEILSTRGSSYQNPAANFMRALRDPIKRAEATAQVFLGTRLQCAQCHNHPFDRWTQDDYYSWAAAFAPVSYKVIENNRRDGLDTHEFNGEQIIFASHKPRVKDPRTGKAAPPRRLGEATDDDIERDLVPWLIKNPQFARAQANRVWSYLMGRGLVDPVDDFRLTNPPSHPELLEQLTEDFITSGFDLRHLIRLITGSRAYQLSAVPNETNQEDAINYSRVLPRRLSAEQLIDAQHQALGVLPEFSGYPAGMRAAQLPGVIAARTRRQRKLSMDDQMLAIFGKPQRLLTCECERSNETTMSQAFQLIGGPSMHGLLTGPNNRLQQLVNSGACGKDIVSELHWTILSRPPTGEEMKLAIEHLNAAGGRRPAVEDLAWALLNAKEFIFRH